MDSTIRPNLHGGNLLDSIRGVIGHVEQDALVVECGPFGIRVRAPAPFCTAQRTGTEIRLLTYLHIREDAFTVFGFPDRTMRDAFEVILGVAGLGPEKALGLLSAMPASAIARAVRDKEPDKLRSVRGIGAKLAERIILELQDKLDAYLGDPLTESRRARVPLEQDLVATLLQLGYPKASSEVAAEAALRALGESATLQDLIKHALRGLKRPLGTTET